MNSTGMARDRWAVILAGGDGMRLRSLTWRLMGDERPKQFCPVIGDRTLLEQTWRRTALAVPADRTLVVVTRKHERFYAPILGEFGPRGAVVQPENRGTAAGILYPLLYLASLDPAASVAIFPSDHHFSDEARFMAHVDRAFDALGTFPQRVVLLGIPPDTHEVEYGWIECGDALPGVGVPVLHQVTRFWEKPEPALAEMLRDRGCLWNTFVMVARVQTLLGLIRSAAPDLSDAFERVRPTLGTPSEAEVVRSLYARLPPIDFSKEILSTRPGLLGLLRVRGVAWSDLGSPERVLSVRQHVDRQAVLA
jgi:mannose-1-phosphate guanylyltransferase